MDIDDILMEWEKDCPISKNDLTSEEIRNASLHSKYIRFLAKARKEIIENEYRFNILKGKKTRYYKNKMSKEELDIENWKPFQNIVKSKADLEEILTVDEDMNNIVKENGLLNTKIEVLTGILNQIKSRTWQIKNIIENKKFEAGV